MMSAKYVPARLSSPRGLKREFLEARSLGGLSCEKGLVAGYSYRQFAEGKGVDSGEAES